MNKLGVKIVFLFFLFTCSSGGGGDAPDSNEDIIPPSVPTNLSASNITETSVDISWNASTDNVGVQTYFVFQDGTNLASNASTSRTISGLQSNTPYTFKVQARDNAGNTFPEIRYARTVRRTVSSSSPVRRW